jgi:hypothetical protein
VTNFGQAELFINFCCAARRVNLDLSKVLLFATDMDTYNLAQAMGVAAFYDEDIFASIPRDSSAKYGDAVYAKIMMSKVYSVHLVSQLKYDFLFQDVDIVPYTGKYLEWFVKLGQRYADFDMFFQNDHNFRAEYAPYVTNSGCYYGKCENVHRKGRVDNACARFAEGDTVEVRIFLMDCFVSLASLL